MSCIPSLSFICPLFFFFNDTATTEIYTLSLHDALPICLQDRSRRRGAASDSRWGPIVAADRGRDRGAVSRCCGGQRQLPRQRGPCHGARCRRGTSSGLDRESTRLHSSHLVISYAVLSFE